MRSVGETAKTILKTRAEDEAALKQSPLKMHLEDEHTTGLDSLKGKSGYSPDILQNYPPKIASEKIQSLPEPPQRKNPVVKI